mgnify:CR=1 FL=1
MKKNPKYLGETLVDVNKHPEFSKYTNTDWAMYFIQMYGGIDGGHHKTWVLDQAARCLKNTPVVVKEAKWDNGEREYRISTGVPSKEYKDWAQSMLGKKDEFGQYEYDYDEGIAP